MNSDTLTLRIKKLAIPIYVAWAMAFSVGEVAAQGVTSENLISFKTNIWPGFVIRSPELGKVNFYKNYHSAMDDECLLHSEASLFAFFSGDTPRLQIGEKCGRLFVLLYQANHGPMSAAALKFAEAHESFHLVAQLFGGPAPSVQIFGTRPKSTPAADKFFDKLSSSLSANSGQENTKTITEIVDSYLALTVSDQYVVDFFSTVEWPAEYYAFMAMSSEDKKWNLSSYLSVRKEIGDEASYRAAVPVGIELDRILGVQKWESRIFKGETMFTLLKEIALKRQGELVDMVQVSSYPLSF